MDMIHNTEKEDTKMSMVPTNSMRVNTTQYQFSHRKQPRGYGLWWFEVQGTDENHVKFAVPIEKAGKYSDALAHAKRYAARLGDRYATIVVLP